MLCDFFKFGLSQNSHDISATISHSILIFVLNASQMKGVVNFVFHIMKMMGL